MKIISEQMLAWAEQLDKRFYAFNKNLLYKWFVDSAPKVAQLEAENEKLIDMVALSNHAEDCYATYWWDSVCDCGLMDLILQMSTSCQNKIDDVRKSWGGQHLIMPDYSPEIMDALLADTQES